MHTCISVRTFITVMHSLAVYLEFSHDIKMPKPNPNLVVTWSTKTSHNSQKPFEEVWERKWKSKLNVTSLPSKLDLVQPVHHTSTHTDISPLRLDPAIIFSIKKYLVFKKHDVRNWSCWKVYSGKMKRKRKHTVIWIFRKGIWGERE